MGRTPDKDRVKKWQSRVTSADKAHKKWSDRFNVDYLEDLYIGEHDFGTEKFDYKVNLSYPSVETRLSMMTVDRPFFRVEAKAPRADDSGSNAEARAKLREDTLNCYAANPRLGLMDVAEMGVKEAHWAFAVAEVVYSNDFIDNPNAGKPLLDETGQDTGTVQPPAYPDPKNKEHEYVAVKRIPAETFRVSMNPKASLRQCDWCGYFEWHYLSDLKANKNYSNTSGLKSNGSIKNEYQDPTSSDENESREGMAKVWKLWDLRAEKRYVFVDGGEKFLLEEDFDIFPFAALRFHKLSKEWYPLPPMFNWIDSQRALNKTRSAQMNYLNHTFSKWLYQDGAIDEAEMDKLASPREGVYAKVNQGKLLSEAVGALQNAPMDASFWRNVPASKEDFVQISAVSSEQRGVAESSTATQASLVDINVKRREVKDATKVAAWFAEIGTILMETIEKRMSLPFVVRTNVDPTGPNAVVEAANVLGTWREITSEQLGDLSYEVSVSVESLSSNNDDVDKQKWTNILGLLGPAAPVVLSSSKLILQKVTGFKSDRDLVEAQKAFQTAVDMMQKMAQAKQGQGSPADPASDPMAMLSQMMSGGMQGGAQ